MCRVALIFGGSAAALMLAFGAFMLWAHHEFTVGLSTGWPLIRGLAVIALIGGFSGLSIDMLARLVRRRRA